jgi:hypothetical protein
LVGGARKFYAAPLEKRFETLGVPNGFPSFHAFPARHMKNAVTIDFPSLDEALAEQPARVTFLGLSSEWKP